jgi:hypothetical protein
MLARQLPEHANNVEVQEARNHLTTDPGNFDEAQQRSYIIDSEIAVGICSVASAWNLAVIGTVHCRCW